MTLRLVGTVIEFSRTNQQTVGLIPMQQEQQQQDALPLQKKSVMHLGRSPAPDRIRPVLRPADADSDPELHTDSDSNSDLSPDSELGS